MDNKTLFLLNYEWLAHGKNDQTYNVMVYQLRTILDILITNRQEVKDKGLITNIQLLLAEADMLEPSAYKKELDTELLELLTNTASEEILNNLATGELQDVEALNKTYRRMQVFANFTASKQRELSIAYPNLAINVKENLATLVTTMGNATAYVGNTLFGQIPFNLKSTQAELTRSVKVFEATSGAYKKAVSKL